jgi:hypothetical protein
LPLLLTFHQPLLCICLLTVAAPQALLFLQDCWSDAPTLTI